MVKETILIVDDNKANLQLLENILVEKGYRVLVAVNGGIALTIASLEHPSLILLDVMMPEMDGYEVCTRLKKDQELSTIPVVFLTAKSDSSDEEHGFMLGAVDYITKPFSVPIVLSRVKTQLSLRKAQQILENQNKYLEDKVRERTEELEEKNSILENLNQQKTLLLRELHHRVMNNLQFLAGILVLQVQNVDNPIAEKILDEYENRIQSLALLHKEFYNSQDFINMNPKNYFDTISMNYLSDFELEEHGIHFIWGNLPEKMNINQAIPFGLVINELLFHLCENFYQQDKKDIYVNFDYKENDQDCSLNILINSDGYSEIWLDPQKRDYRFNILEVLLSQLEGRVSVDSDKNVIFRLLFKKTSGVNYSDLG